MCLNVALPLLPYGYVQNLIKKIPQKKPKTSFFCLFLNFAPPLLPDAGNLIQKILNVAPPLLPYVRNSIQKIPQKAKYHFFCLFPNVWNPSPGGVWVETFFFLETSLQEVSAMRLLLFFLEPLSRRCMRRYFLLFFWNLSPGGVGAETFLFFRSLSPGGVWDETFVFPFFWNISPGSCLSRYCIGCFFYFDSESLSPGLGSGASYLDLRLYSAWKPLLVQSLPQTFALSLVGAILTRSFFSSTTHRDFETPKRYHPKPQGSPPQLPSPATLPTPPPHNP